MDIKNTKGVTLVEVIVTIAIILIIMLPISLVFTTAYSGFIEESDKITAQQAARELLYGKGLNSYGIMGDLERSNSTSQNIKVGSVAEDLDAIGDSITIIYDTGITKKYSKVGNSINYEVTGGPVSDYFINDKSSNGKSIVIKGFECEKIKKNSIIASDTIKITVTVECGKSGEVSLSSSYRLPNIER